MDVEALLETYHEMFLSLEEDDETVKQIAEEKHVISLAEQKKNKLLELVTTGVVSPANFKSMIETCDREIEEAKKMIAELEEQRFTQEEYRKHMNEVRTRLDAAIKDANSGMITEEFVAQYIDKIYVTLIDDDTAKLEIKIFTGKSTEKWIKKLNARSKCRTGLTSKKMISKYESNMQ